MENFIYCAVFQIGTYFDHADILRWAFNPLTTNIPTIEKPVSWSAEQINWLLSMWREHWSLKG